MNKRVAIVLVCTFLAWVAATVWVPIRYGSDPTPKMVGDAPYFGFIWNVGPPHGLDPSLVDYFEINMPMLAFEYAVIVAVSLLAVFFRTRAARRPGQQDAAL